MKRDKHFSFEDDPAFSEHDDNWWKQWQQNQQKQQTSARICNGCLNEREDGTCDIYAHAEQSAIIGSNACDDKLE